MMQTWSSRFEGDVEFPCYQPLQKVWKEFLTFLQCVKYLMYSITLLQCLWVHTDVFPWRCTLDLHLYKLHAIHQYYVIIIWVKIISPLTWCIYLICPPKLTLILSLSLLTEVYYNILEHYFASPTPSRSLVFHTMHRYIL